MKTFRFEASVDGVTVVLNEEDRIIKGGTHGVALPRAYRVLKNKGRLRIGHREVTIKLKKLD